MATLPDVSTASVLARGPIERVRDVVVRTGRESWVVPGGNGWVVVLPDGPGPTGARDDVDPYDLVGLGRTLCDSGLGTVLVMSERNGLALCQLMSPHHDTAFIGWRTAESGEPPASRVEPDAPTFAARLGAPERTEVLELVLEDVSGTSGDRLDALCWALALPAVAVGATASRLSSEELHLPGMERQTHRSTLERLFRRDGDGLGWTRRTWARWTMRLVVLAFALGVFADGWFSRSSMPHLLLGVATSAMTGGLLTEAALELRRRSRRWRLRVPEQRSPSK
jgi:hypothetical protein